MVLEKSFLTVFPLGGCGGLGKSSFLTVSPLEGCGGLERTKFELYPLWEGVVVLKELNFNSCYFGRLWWS